MVFTHTAVREVENDQNTRKLLGSCPCSVSFSGYRLNSDCKFLDICTCVYTFLLVCYILLKS